MSGPSAGTTGKVLRVIRRKNQMVIEGVNVVRDEIIFKSILTSSKASY